MNGFLDDVARDLWACYGEDVQRLTVLFPSRRARLFFTRALGGQATRPIWQPRYATIDEVMERVAGLERLDRVRLLTELYKAYSRYHDEPFDRFYYWGELLVADFDQLDKYRIDARMLFRNLGDLKQIESDLSYLTPEQREVVARFWQHVEGGNPTEEKQRFLALWRTLEPLYADFRARLTELGAGYAGMIQRRAVERLEAGEGFDALPERVAVVGFNALTECEKRLLDRMARRGDVRFYWDYDRAYLDPPHEAGLFVRENLRRFPQRAPLPGQGDAWAAPKQLVAVETRSDAVQCKEAGRLLAELARSGPLGAETAVVLTDESLLVPLLHALPPEVAEVNVTMGFPLRTSPVYTLVDRMAQLQMRMREAEGGADFYHRDVEGLLVHPCVTGGREARCRTLRDEMMRHRRIRIAARELTADEGLAALFRPVAEWQAMGAWMAGVLEEMVAAVGRGAEERLRRECLEAAIGQIRMLDHTLAACGVELTGAVYASLLRRHLQSVRLPFEGEPLGGVQVMGILETRALDFENVILLSMSDDRFPGNRAEGSSFIPYNLRAAYGLPTPEHREGVYAYYFYRLIQRARRVWMLYSGRSDERSTGEESRYIHQLAYESPHGVQRTRVAIGLEAIHDRTLQVPKTGEVALRLEEFLREEEPIPLSPTALERYAVCPMRFYFHTVARLRPPEERSEEVDAQGFGTILHRAMQLLYRPLCGVAEGGRQVASLGRGTAVEEAVEEAIRTEWFDGARVSERSWSGDMWLVRDILVRYIRGAILPFDAAHDGFSVEGLEHTLRTPFSFAEGRRVMLGGTLDRIDRLTDGGWRVVDYKTGAPRLDFGSVDRLFAGEARDELGAAFQILLYAGMLARRGGRVQPALYYVRAMGERGYDPRLQWAEREGARRTPHEVADYAEVAEPFEEGLRALLAELFDPRVPFTCCEQTSAACAHCDFGAVCGRR